MVIQIMHSWEIPIFADGAILPILSNKTRYPNFARTNPPYDKLGPAAVAIMKVRNACARTVHTHTPRMIVITFYNPDTIIIAN